MNSMYQPYPGSETQLPEPQRPPAPPSVLTAVKIWGAVAWLVALAAVVFLWRRSSTAYFKATPS
jgi:hypothetical protein